MNIITTTINLAPSPSHRGRVSCAKILRIVAVYEDSHLVV